MQTTEGKVKFANPSVSVRFRAAMDALKLNVEALLVAVETPAANPADAAFQLVLFL